MPLHTLYGVSHLDLIIQCGLNNLFARFIGHIFESNEGIPHLHKRPGVGRTYTTVCYILSVVSCPLELLRIRSYHRIQTIVESARIAFYHQTMEYQLVSCPA
ncbi:hypothetical protein SAMN05216388_104718 [Halorientalis persicus]|uniref:Uncharacterized protein n=1 Tax=Halorientalis persicus TaxID=1367881 RepID=A0A1H8W3Z1_9EURY|nr:hypothetical protein SAMN05216388_104718 [Halorientalis persicus]